jgi:hypothetical protein
MNLNRLRFKIFTSFALFGLAVVTIVRLWGVAPPTLHNAGAYATAAILAAAALWRGIIFARAAAPRVK